jgi:acyl-CoA synthetase (AMP-forming)/AMP-acid ligase II
MPVGWRSSNSTPQAAAGVLVESDSVPVFFPLFHANALAYTVLPTVWSGGTVILMPKFSSSRFWEITGKHRCTWANMVHFTIRALQDLPEPPSIISGFGCWSLRLPPCMSAGAFH